ncbi:cryptochrome/photolyase family protein [Reichenbachiella versicolor]|uniref:cryptochrome/photolyase family protein n=1 Tax=Reichenbachiella versicolor TaxID=1821036 RepID=UPI000D6E09DC|nr:cryptochrome/photolyase family protein [Reichenbachiella versicolor]
MKEAIILFPHQLFDKLPMLCSGNQIFLIEHHLFFNQYSFHKRKLAFNRASMKKYENMQKNKGLDIQYIEAQDSKNDCKVLFEHFKEQGIEKVHWIDPTDDWLSSEIRESLKTYGLDSHSYENPNFLNSLDDLKTFFKPNKKSFFQTTWYKQQRVKRNILIDQNQQPLGGQWTYDVDNRKKYPKGKTPPSIQLPTSDEYWSEAVKYIEHHFSGNYGSLDTNPIYPTDSESAKGWLKEFISVRLLEFGDYEDAIVSQSNFLHHSILTPMLNVGLLSPNQIIDLTLEQSANLDIPINSLEGFIRQIIGWREFIRGMYDSKGRYSRTRNYWGFKRKIPQSFYDGTTGIPPIDQTIRKVLETGYCHHIERLMILGNFMLLCEFDPNEVYRWFMELFIDAYDWVMVPNVYGMSQFADGGLFATKPYISGSNYIMKMSNYPKGEWQTIWDSLFWRFMDIHRTFFIKNPRLGMLIKNYDKKTPSQQKMLHQTAEHFLSSLR